jgi:hypothetical protein
MKRKKISEDIEAEVIWRSNRECVVCSTHKRGDHIHHIDGDSSNNKFENLAFLCFDCHNEASVKNSLRKKLTPKAIIKFREHKYKLVEAERNKMLEVFASSLKGLTTEDILVTTKNAVIIIEIEKIREEYFAAEWEDRSSILDKINKFREHSNFRVAVDLFNFLAVVADQTRARMPTEVAVSVFSIIVDFFPYARTEADKRKVSELANQCANIGFSLIYDAAVHLKNYTIMMWGLTILKFLFKEGKEQKITPVTQKVNEIYKEIEQTLERPGRDDLKDALQLVKEFKADIGEGTLAFPMLSANLMKLIEKNDV